MRKERKASGNVVEKSDLRVTKTVRLIQGTFLEMICEKPVDKITVVGIAKKAEINKGTFYLHYANVFELYDEMLEEVVSRIAGKFDPYPYFFTDPELFVREFLFSHAKPPRKEEVAMLKEENLRFTAKYPMMFVDAFRKRLYDVGKLAPCRENDMRLEYVLNGMLALLIRPGLLDVGNPSGDQYAIRLLAGSIRQLFPEFHA